MLTVDVSPQSNFLVPGMYRGQGNQFNRKFTLETKWNVEMGQELSYYSITEGQPASKYTHPNKKNWITVHAVTTECMT